MLGPHATSILSVGVRFAQLTSRENIQLSAAADYYYGPVFSGKNDISRSFHGIGPSISWDASVPLVGSRQTSQIGLEWGVHGAVLFGRQKVLMNEAYKIVTGPQLNLVPHTYAATRARAKGVTIPNIGASLAVSYRLAIAKVSLGYRADYFFGAIDGGINTQPGRMRR